jgi:hypothetical protein
MWRKSPLASAYARISDAAIYRIVIDETRWGAVFPGDEWSIPLIDADFPLFGSKSGLGHFRCLSPSTSRSEECSGFLERFLAVRSDLYVARLLALLNEAWYSTFVNGFFIQHRSASYGLDGSSPASPLSSDGLHPARGPADSHHAGFDPRKRCVSHLSNSLVRRTWLVYSLRSESSLLRPGDSLAGPSSALSLPQPLLSSQDVPRKSLRPCRPLSAPDASGNASLVKPRSHRRWSGRCLFSKTKFLVC